MLTARGSSAALLIALLLCTGFPVFAHAAVSTLIWGGGESGQQEITIEEVGTYTVPLNQAAPIFVSGPPEFANVVATLYLVTGAGDSQTRQELTTVYPQNPNGDPNFSWPSAGSYELDVSAFSPPVLKTIYN